MNERVCPLCGEKFQPKSSRRKICYKEHYHPCPVCGEPVLTTDLQHTGNCCCPEHSKIKANRNQSKTWKSKSEEEWKQIDDKKRATYLERYGVDNASKCPEIIDKIKNSYSKFKESDKYSTMVENRKQACLEKYGVDHPFKSEVVRSKILSTIHERYGEDVTSTFQVKEFKDKSDMTNLETYGTTIPMQNHEIWSKQTSQRSKIVACDGLKLDSEYEKIFYEYFLRHNLSVQRSIPISYEYKGVEHKTFVDFLVDGILFECKGEHILDGYFDYRGIPISEKLDVYRKHNIVVVTGSSHSYMFSENPKGVDLDLFRQDVNWIDILHKLNCYNGFVSF